MNELAIFAKELVKEFNVNKHAVRAVDQLSLQVVRGETYGLIGPDGAGKSTTTRVILGLLTRTSGESSVL
jgi:ABC-2 type transport system ATP-binding protein